MTDLVLRAGTVITVDSQRRVIRDGAVAVEGDRIIEVGEGAAIERRHRGAQLLAYPMGILLPGLIDAHGHAGHSLVRTLGGDDLGAWLEACEQIYRHGSTRRFWEVDGALSALERLTMGTTTGLSMLGGAGDTIRCDAPDYARAHAAGVRRIGIRDIVVVGPGAPPFPKETTDVESGTAVRSSFDDQMGALRTLVAESEGADKQSVAVTFPTLSLGDVEAGGHLLTDCAGAVASFAAEHDLLIVQDGHRGDTVSATDRLGLATDRTLVSHAVDLDSETVDLLAERGASVAHNPSAVFSQFGRCPVPELMDAGVTVALGSDATAPDRSSDMFRHMFQATRYHRADRRDPALFPPGRVLEMATIDGATALGLGESLGSVEEGKLADVVLVDAAKPHLTPLIHPVHQLVYYATGSDVDTVIVGGEVGMRGGVPVGIDVDAVLAEAQEEYRSTIERSGLEHLEGDRPGTWGQIRYRDGAGLDT